MHMNFKIKAKFPKRDDNIKMRYLYHIRCNPDLVMHNYAMRIRLCEFQECRLSLKQPWEANFDADKQPSYSVHVVYCKYAPILGAYNRWYIIDLVVFHIAPIDTDVDYID